MIIVRLEDVSEADDPLLHEDLVVVVPQLLQQDVHLVGAEAVALQGVREEQHQVLDLQHETRVGAVRRVGLEGRHDLERGLGPDLVQVASGHEAVARVQDVVLAHEEADDAVEEGAVALDGLVHVGRRLERERGL